ncbi:MAG: Gfo/Idh/MocA family oxidoreductase [Candidatus Bathyarchaeota archaeon]|nr:Gfo/Idh/MocA family oxidoreductase [Candidatus Bathyarchaeota archaeon]
MSKILSLGLIGCGGISASHVNGLKELYTHGLKVVRVDAVCDIALENAERRAEEIALIQGFKPRVYSSLEDMFSKESLEAVDICLPHDQHHSIAIRCLEEDLHVLIEKPLAITMRAAKLIIDKATSKSRILAVAENYRRTPDNRTVKWIMDQHMIGEPRMIFWLGLSWNPKPWGWRENKFKAGGSWVFDGGVHIADIDRYHLGREAVEVYAKNRIFEPFKDGVESTVDDATLAIIEYEGDVYAQWSWSRIAPGYPLNLRVIYGSRGSIYMPGLTNFPSGYVRIQIDGYVEERSISFIRSEAIKAIKPEILEEMFPRGITDSFAIEIYDFYRSIVYGLKPEVDGIEAYRDMAIPLAFYESAKLGEPVKVKDVEGLKVEEYQADINEYLGLR